MATPRGFFDPTAVSRPAWFDVTEFARGWFDRELLQIVSHVEWGWLAGGIGGPPFTVGADGRISFKPRKQFKKPRTTRARVVVHAVRVNAPATVRVAQPQRVESVAITLSDPRFAQRVREDEDVLLGVL